MKNNNEWAGEITLATSAVRINSDTDDDILTISGTIVGGGQALTIGGLGDTTINSNLPVTLGTLTKDGSGTLILSGNNNSLYQGEIDVTAGVLKAQNSNALGDPTYPTVVSSGAELDIDGSGFTIFEKITLTGTGIGDAGALRNLANNNEWAGEITLATSAVRINSDTDDAVLTISGTIVGRPGPAGRGNPQGRPAPRSTGSPKVASAWSSSSTRYGA